MSRSRLEKFKPMADFDWNLPTAIDRSLVESLLSLDFLEGARNVVLVAPGGLGKTMIAQNISLRAVLAGRFVLLPLRRTAPARSRRSGIRARPRTAPPLLRQSRASRRRRARVSRLRQPKCRPHLSGHQSQVRKEKPRPDYQSRLRRLAHDLSQRHLRHGSRRASRPSCRHRQGRVRELSPSRISGGRHHPKQLTTRQEAASRKLRPLRSFDRSPTAPVSGCSVFRSS
jgi:hypothetical protein